MENVITASIMMCFPYVIVGLGQAIILGTHSAEEQSVTQPRPQVERYLYGI